MNQKVYTKNISIGFFYMQFIIAIIIYYLLTLINLTDKMILLEIISIILITTSLFYFFTNEKIVIESNGLEIGKCWYPLDKIIEIRISNVNTNYSGEIIILDIEYSLNVMETWNKRIQLTSYNKQVVNDLEEWCLFNKITFQQEGERTYCRND